MLSLVRLSKDGTRTVLYSLIPMPAPPDAYWRSWLETFRGPRSQAARLVRRCGDEVRRYEADPSNAVTIECCDGRRQVEPTSDLASLLHDLFGLSATWLRAHFASLGRRAAG
jgi:hypothetical protein